MSYRMSRRTALAGCATALAAAQHAGASEMIHTEGFVRIGGIDQWVAINGFDARNPLIVFLHGGPAEAQSPFLRQFLPWERKFTVVNWDQRGAGKTFGRNGPSTPDMTLARMVLDAIEVAEFACRKAGRRKVILVSHSWGAILGMHAVKQRPDLFDAFVGSGQPVSWPLTMATQEHWTLEQATRLNDQATLKALSDTAALPITDWKRIGAANAYRWAPSDLGYLKIQREFVGSPPAKGDAADWAAGGAFSIPHLLGDIFSFDAFALAPMPVPFFVIQGRDDHVTSFDAAQVFVEKLKAPMKGFLPIDGGHFALFTNPDAFVAALVRYVRPLAGT